ncbi:hypothetical protein pdam_00010536, partial [Pocillopora damicornis]
ISRWEQIDFRDGSSRKVWQGPLCTGPRGRKDMITSELQEPTWFKSLAQLNHHVGVACLPEEGSTPNLPMDDVNKKCWMTGRQMSAE